MYLTDLACTVAQHADVRYPELTTQLWHNKQGCFETPSSYEHPQVTENYLDFSVFRLVIFVVLCFLLFHGYLRVTRVSSLLTYCLFSADVVS